MCVKRLWLVVLLGSSALAQETFPKLGIRDKTPNVVALTGATVIVQPGQRLENAVLIVRDGRIEAVGKNISIPKDATVVSCAGLWIYPGLIDPFTDYGYRAPAIERRTSGGPQYHNAIAGPYHWNQAVRAEVDHADHFAIDAKKAADLRALGFTAVQSMPMDGIFRGTASVVLLGEGQEHEQMVRTPSGLAMSFNKGSSTQSYPSSIMGTLALIRQTFLDAGWYKTAHAVYRKNPGQKAPEINLTLDALVRTTDQRLPVFFETRSTQDVVRAISLMAELGQTAVIRGSGSEFERLDAIKKTGSSLILPLTFPKSPDVDDPDDAIDISLHMLTTWELAPSNASMVADAGIPFAWTSSGLSDVKQFWPAIRRCLDRGLHEDRALDALTRTPAKMIGAEVNIGSLEKGKLANFIVTSGNLFDASTTIYETWVKGKKFTVQERPLVDIRGRYTIEWSGMSRTMNISGTPVRPLGHVFFRDSSTVDVSITIKGLECILTLQTDSLGQSGWARFSGSADSARITGRVVTADGRTIPFVAVRTGPPTDTKKGSVVPKDSAAVATLRFPNTAFGYREPPPQRTVLFRGATVWTNTSSGILPSTDVLIEGGKIKTIGKNLALPKGAVEIDARGRHLTSGIIDEHSHIALTTANEGTHAVTAEVRMADAIDADDIDIYRQLAGGVTASHLLHGSANPIGGQSQLIKLRWGLPASELIFQGAPGFIKFALGENVKQVHWGDEFRTRYPQSRPGVEQIIRDAFIAAKEYRQAWSDYRKAGGEKSALIPPRRDLQMETLVEILEGQRHITCHSYVQSEILMLIRLAEEIGFNVNTFTHVLEGYKIVDAIKHHGAAGSTFSDWWAYKFEVYDAIPHNAALMQRAGILVAINSDDSEMGRRLNQEAAKSVKYAGMPEEDAWKMVTLNPARMLHVDDRVGSIESGKDADVVLWSDHPLSNYARALQTYVDGRCYWDADRDAEVRRIAGEDRTRLVQKLLSSKKSDGNNKTAVHPQRKLGCDSLGDDVH